MNALHALQRALCLLTGWGAAAVVLAADPVKPGPLPDTWAQRTLACTGCHGPQGRSSALGHVPRLAGKPAAYLQQQLQAFRDGRRSHEGMAHLLALLDDEVLADLARHFAAQKVAYEPPPARAITPATQQRALALLRQGDPARRLPACAGCHGPALVGVMPAVPGLLGLPRDYVVEQLGAWKAGTRRARAPDCMAQVVQALSAEDIAALGDWLSAQTVPQDAEWAAKPPGPWPLACGTVQP